MFILLVVQLTTYWKIDAFTWTHTRWRPVNKGGQFLVEQLNPAITDANGPINFICFWRVSVCMLGRVSNDDNKSDRFHSLCLQLEHIF